MYNEELYRRVWKWSDLPAESIRPGVRRRGYATDQVMLVLNELEFGMEENPHRHEDFDQLACILEGTAHYFVDEEPHLMEPGSMMLVPAGSMHFVRPLEPKVANLDIFVPPRSDFLHLLSYVGRVAGPT